MLNLKDWIYCKTEEEAKEALTKHEDYDLCHSSYVEWKGPGNYYFRWTEEPCGRGCCYDTILVLNHAREIVSNLEKQYEDLGKTLEFVKGKL